MIEKSIIDPSDCLVVTCLFGSKWSVLYPAMKEYRCVIFSNNPKIEKEAIKKGWEFKLVKRFLPLTNDFLECRLQTKYTKFLEFLYDFNEFRIYKFITCIDHKNIINFNELERLRTLFDPNKKIFMISSFKGWSVSDALTVSCESYESYRLHEKETRSWIQSKVDAGLASWDGQEYACSFIMYKNYDSILPFLKEVYDRIWILRQPHCQVIWGVMIQSRLDELQLQSIHWKDTSMFRRTPLPLRQEIKRTIRKYVKKAISPMVDIFGINYEDFRKHFIIKIFGDGIK